jgi:hypothetical protein
LTSFEIFGTLLEPIWRVSKRHCIMRFVWSCEIGKTSRIWIGVKCDDWIVQADLIIHIGCLEFANRWKHLWEV